jgi:hypothetical protein
VSNLLTLQGVRYQYYEYHLVLCLDLAVHTAWFSCSLEVSHREWRKNESNWVSRKGGLFERVMARGVMRRQYQKTA